MWGPQAIRLGFVGGALATATSYNLTVSLPSTWGLLAETPPVPVDSGLCSLPRPARSFPPLPSEDGVFQARHSHFIGSRWDNHGVFSHPTQALLISRLALFRMVGMGSLRACRFCFRPDIPGCSVSCPFHRIDVLSSTRFARYRQCRPLWQLVGCRQGMGGKMGKSSDPNPQCHVRFGQQVSLEC